MDAWVCAACGRSFGRNRQSHDCAPGLTLEEYFATGPTHERPVYEAVTTHLKNPRKFAEIRPMTRWVAVSFSLPRRARHRTITRRVIEYHGRYWHTANVVSPTELDDDLCQLLTEAYRASAEATLA